MESYYEVSGVPIVGVQASRGGEASSYFTGAEVMSEMIARYNEAEKYLTDNGYTIGKKFVVWCQGESDADKNRIDDSYKSNTLSIFNSLKTGTGLTDMFMIRIGHCKTSGAAAIDETKDPNYKRINLAQKALADANSDITAVGSFYTDEYEPLIPKAFGVAGMRGDLPMRGMSPTDVNWAVYELENDIPVDGNDFSINAGVLSSNGLAKPQQLRVRASKGDVDAYVTFSVVESNQFEITNVGYDGGDEKDVNDGKQRIVDENHLVRLYVNKLGEYKDDVVFLMTLFDKSGKLVGSYSKKASGKSLKTGANEVAIDYTLPAGFNKSEGKVKIVAWTALTTREEPEGVSTDFRASYADGTVTFTGLPAISGKCTVAIYKEGTKDSELSGDISSSVRYVSQFSDPVSKVDGLDLTNGKYTISVGGRDSNGEYFVCRAEFTVE